MDAFFDSACRFKVIRPGNHEYVIFVPHIGIILSFCNEREMVSEKGSVNLSGVLPRFVHAKESAIGLAQVLKADEKFLH